MPLIVNCYLRELRSASGSFEVCWLWCQQSLKVSWSWKRQRFLHTHPVSKIRKHWYSCSLWCTEWQLSKSSWILTQFKKFPMMRINWRTSGRISLWRTSEEYGKEVENSIVLRIVKFLYSPAKCCINLQQPLRQRLLCLAVICHREHICHFFLAFFRCEFFVNKRYMWEINRSRSHVNDYT